MVGEWGWPWKGLRPNPVRAATRNLLKINNAVSMFELGLHIITIAPVHHIRRVSSFSTCVQGAAIAIIERWGNLVRASLPLPTHNLCKHLHNRATPNKLRS